ncbi:hypothetical protein D3C72_1259230 [compost metagenome]
MNVVVKEAKEVNVLHALAVKVVGNLIMNVARVKKVSTLVLNIANTMDKVNTKVQVRRNVNQEVLLVIVQTLANTKVNVVNTAKNLRTHRHADSTRRKANRLRHWELKWLDSSRRSLAGSSASRWQLSLPMFKIKSIVIAFVYNKGFAAI